MNKQKSITSIKRCRICGDQASGFNFNVLSCESCKAFFRRNAFKNDLECKNKNTCEINRFTRTNCMKCRFDKCVQIGMKKELVSCVSNRINPLKPNPSVLPINRINVFSNERTLNLKMVELSRLGELYKAVMAFPNESSWKIVGQVESVSQMINLSTANIKHIVRFCKNMSEFNCLSKNEQVIALKGFVPEINQIRLAFLYNTQTNGWIGLEHPECDKKAVFARMDLMKSIFNKEMFNFLSNFVVDLHREMENDYAIRDLIIVQSVFKPRPTMYPNHEFVRYHNVVFHYLLRRYLEHKYLDKRRATQKFTSLMGLLAKMDTITNAIRDYFASPHITMQVAPVLRQIYNLNQTLQIVNKI